MNTQLNLNLAFLSPRQIHLPLHRSKDTDGSPRLFSVGRDCIEVWKSIISCFLEASDDKVLLLCKSVISSINSAAAVCRGWIFTVVCFKPLTHSSSHSQTLSIRAHSSLPGWGFFLNRLEISSGGFSGDIPMVTDL